MKTNGRLEPVVINLFKSSRNNTVVIVKAGMCSFQDKVDFAENMFAMVLMIVDPDARALIDLGGSYKCTLSYEDTKDRLYRRDSWQYHALVEKQSSIFTISALYEGFLNATEANPMCLSIFPDKGKTAIY